DHRVAIADINLLAAASGPGTFTGVRVGLTAAKGLAAAGGKRVAPVSNLAATAMLALRAHGPAAIPVLFVPLLDARRGQVYAGAYLHERGAALRGVTTDFVVSPTALPETVAALAAKQ